MRRRAGRGILDGDRLHVRRGVRSVEIDAEPENGQGNLHRFCPTPARSPTPNTTAAPELTTRTPRWIPPQEIDMASLPRAPDAAKRTSRRRRRPLPPRRRADLVLGDPIVIGHDAIATSLDGAPWASPGDRLIIRAAAGKVSGAIVTAAHDADHAVVEIMGGRDISGDVRVMRAPTLPLDRRALVRRGRVAGGAP